MSEDASWSFSDATNGANILPWELKVLLEWHHQDTVSAKEIARNDTIYYHFQNNRNPFIDHPEWADSIWGKRIIVQPNGINSLQAKKSISVFPNPATEQFKIETTDFPFSYIITDVSGRIIEESTINSANHFVNCSQWNKGLYIICFKNKKGTFTNKFVKL